MSASKGKKIIVIGGGLAGLSYVHYLRTFLIGLDKGNLLSKVTLLESNNYMGGCMKTACYEDGPIHELGPRSIRRVGARTNNTVALLEQLGLGDKIVPIDKSSVAAKDRYLYTRGGELLKLGVSFKSLFKRIPGGDKLLLPIVLKEFRTPKIDLDKFPHQDPSIYEFVKYRMGEQVAECIIDPMLRGISAGDARRLSMTSMFRELVEKEQAYGSVLASVSKAPVTKMRHDEFFPRDILESKLVEKLDKQGALSYSLSTGLQTLPEHLSNSLLNSNDDQAVEIYNQTKVVSLEYERESVQVEKSGWKVGVKTVDGDMVTMHADHVVAAVPSTNLMQLSMPLEQRAALMEIDNIEHVPVGCVTVEYRELDTQKLPNFVNSFGFLTHSKSDSRLLGISFDSSCFPAIDAPFKSTRMTCMMGGAWFREKIGDPDRVSERDLEQVALEGIAKHMGISAEPHRMTAYLWRTGIAQHAPGHQARVTRTREAITNRGLPLTLVGQSYDGITVNDVIYTARLSAYDTAKAL